MIRKWFLILFGIFTLAAAAGADNTVTNPGFEIMTGAFPDSWTAVGSVCEVSTAQVHSGARSCRLYRASGKPPEQETGLNRWYEPNVSPGAMLPQKKGWLSFYYKAVSSGADSILHMYIIPMGSTYVENTGKQRTDFQVPGAHIGDGQWHQGWLKYDYSADAAVAWIQISPRITGADEGEMYFDDFCYNASRPATLQVGNITVLESSSCAGDSGTVQARIDNIGDLQSDNFKAQISLPGYLWLPNGDTVQTVTRINGSSSKNASWLVYGTREAVSDTAIVAIKTTGDIVIETKTFIIKPVMQISLLTGKFMLLQGETSVLSCSVLNTGTAKIADVAGEISFGPGIQVESTACSSVLRVPPGETSALSWVIKAQSQTQSTTLSLIVSASNHGALYASAQFQVCGNTVLPVPSGVTGARIENGVAVLENQNVYVAFVKSDFGYGISELKMNSSSGWITAGKMPDLGRLVYFSSGATRTFGVYADSDPETRVISDTASLVFRRTFIDSNSNVWDFSAGFSVANADNAISCSYSAVCSGTTAVSRFYGPLFYVGEGSFGTHKNEALFPAMDWQLEGERSSNPMDGLPPYQDKTVPPPFSVCVPMMVIREGDNSIGMIWNPQDNWTTPAAADTPVMLTAKFATPNFLENRENHYLALMAPAVPWYIPRNEDSGYTDGVTPLTFTLPANNAINISAKIPMIANSSSVLDMMDKWFAVYGIPDTPALPLGTYENALDFCADAFTSTMWDTPSQGWFANKPNAWPPAPDAVTRTCLYLRAILCSDPVRKANIMSQVNRAGAAQDGGYQTFDQSLRLGRPEQAAQNAMNQAFSLISSQYPDGGWRWYPTDNHQLLWWKPSVSGTNTENIRTILRAARILKSDQIKAAGLKGLDFLDNNFGPGNYPLDPVPRGAQVWEVPMHCPDGYAAGLASQCYIEGYRLTGDTEYLRKAVYWAKAFMPFNVFWANPNRARLLYSHYPIMGTTWYNLSKWWEWTVQWCGMAGAKPLYYLKDIDNTYPWYKIVNGVTIAGMRLQYASPDYGCYPDGFSQPKDEDAYYWSLGPIDQFRNILMMLGYDIEAQTAIMQFNTATLNITPGSRLETASMNGDTLAITTSWPQGETAFIFISGIGEPGAVRKGAQRIYPTSNIDAVAEGWKYDKSNGYLYVKLNYNTGTVTAYVSGAKAWTQEIAPYNSRLVINKRDVLISTEKSTVTVYIKDNAGNPMPGKKITVYTGRGPAYDSISYPDGSVTDSAGACVAYIYSDTPGEDTVTAMLEETSENAQGLILNPSFENGISAPENWYFISAPSSSWAWDTNAYSGSRSITSSTGASGDNYAIATWGSNMWHRADPGMKIWFSGRVKTNLLEGAASMRIGWLNNGTVIKDIEISSLAGANPWTYWETQAIIPAGINGFGVACYNGGWGNAGFDDIDARVLPVIQYNLVSNGSFEAGSTSWNFAANRGAWSIDSGEMFDGIACLKHTCASSADNYTEQIFRPGAANPVTCPVSPWENLRASMYMKTQLSSGSAYIRIIWFYDSTVLYENLYSGMSGTTDWVYRSADLTVPWNANGLMFRCQNAGVGTAWFDKCSLQYIPNLSFNEISASHLLFTSAPFSITTTQASDTVTAGLYDQYWNAVLTWNKPVYLSSTSPAGRFSLRKDAWQDTSVISAPQGTLSFFYRDRMGGSPRIRAATASLMDTQAGSVVMPVVAVTKFQAKINTAVNFTTSPIVALGGETVEWLVIIRNSGTETAINVLVTDSEVFETGRYNTGNFIRMDTVVAGYNSVDSWAYSLDPGYTVWQAWGSVPSAGQNIKGLRWKIKALGINDARAVKFRCRIK